MHREQLRLGQPNNPLGFLMIHLPTLQFHTRPYSPCQLWVQRPLPSRPIHPLDKDVIRSALSAGSRLLSLARPGVDHLITAVAVLDLRNAVEQQGEVAQEERSHLPKLLRLHENDDHQGPVRQLFHVVGVAVESVPSALGRVAAAVAVRVREVVAAVGVVDGVALRELVATVPAVEETLLAVAGLVADTVLEEVVAADALSDGRAVLVELHVVAALQAVVVAAMRVALLLEKQTIIYLCRLINNIGRAMVEWLQRTEGSGFNAHQPHKG